MSEFHMQPPDISRPQLSPVDQAVNDFELKEWLNVFFDRLYHTFPLVHRYSLYRDFRAGRHHTDTSFKAMLCTMCAMAMVTPVLSEDMSTFGQRNIRAASLLEEAIRPALVYDWGERSSLEDVISRFLLFATLFGMEKSHAALLKLREAVDLGCFLKLQQAESYGNLGPEDVFARLRVFLQLSITERGFALQRNHPIVLTGQPIESMHQVYAACTMESSMKASIASLYDSQTAQSTLGLLQLVKILNSIDETISGCLNRSRGCLKDCRKLSHDLVTRVHADVANVFKNKMACASFENFLLSRIGKDKFDASSGHAGLSTTQWADSFVLQKWAIIRLWTACITHDLLGVGQSGILSAEYAVQIAEETIEECHRIGHVALELHGIGMVERLHDIAIAVVMSMQWRSIPYEPPDGSLEASLLEDYINILDNLRCGAHRFGELLRDACATIPSERSHQRASVGSSHTDTIRANMNGRYRGK
ncbi:Hypothetical protein D9617_1g088790 [Elsinoe fawcettii]|nr:Hypothetical protein D9617_1g088790 [Elsinoe fawcettii]